MVDGVNFEVTDGVDRKSCEGCALGKQHRQPFPKKSQHKACKPLELIHTDVCGPNFSPLGYRFVVNFIDDYGKYTYVYIIKLKSELFEKFNEFVEQTENHTGYLIHTVVCDNRTSPLSYSFVVNCNDDYVRNYYVVFNKPKKMFFYKVLEVD